MAGLVEVLAKATAFLTTEQPRPGLHPIPGTKVMTIEALVLPPVIYYIALLFLPPPPPQAVDTISIKLLRSTLALVAGFLFFRMPLAYHIPQSIGLNYQLSLVGLYGGCRVLDAFFISPAFFDHIPRRVRYEHQPRAESPPPAGTVENSGPESPNTKRKRVGYADGRDTPSTWDRRPSLPLNNYFPASASSAASTAVNALGRTLSGPKKEPVYQFETPEDGWPHTFLDRASWALELELSMRGMGFTWTTADVRHTRKTWLPTIKNRLHSIFVHVLPVMAVCLFVIRYTYDNHLGPAGDPPPFDGPSRFDTRLSPPLQLALTAALGAFLMLAFSLAHSIFAIVCAPLAPSPFAFFPPLYTTPIWKITSVRRFWSYGWHRLFARLFLVYGVWPGEWAERKLTGKGPNQRADLGKVVGGFLSSAFVHTVSVRSVLGGDWIKARGEGIFFVSNGCAVVVEEIVRRVVVAHRKSVGSPLEMWYDAWLGRIWWISVLLLSGRNFARGWVNAGLVREMAGR
ncbi:hypothetical protein LTR36_004909 [Oleoguttula mirabilis]|uniref:Wax synthase domain-containing protein n=1 Tax=Oleoguttula mirabilis TaxID=1507867 RepID=A0AAV9JV93_9PEZI|nr:hypothetical protein LTR36_004909 [Oleoguttula mirabilis]